MKKKRVFFISLIFIVSFSLIASGCTLGGADSSCHGLCNNSVINLPQMLSGCYNGCVGSCLTTKDYIEVPFADSDYSVRNVSICDNSEGDGKNGYVTVKLELDLPFIFNNPPEDTHYLTYKINVYDNGQLAGSAIVVRDSDEIQQLKDTYVEYYKESEDSLIAHPYFVDYFNVSITDYISGNFTCEVEYVKGKYIK